jgi:PAS domain S-box-containing protein
MHWVWPGEQSLHVSWLKGLAFVLATAMLLAVYLNREQARGTSRAARHIATTAALLEHFRALSERVSDIVLLVDEQDRIIEANDAAVEALGWPRAALCERTISDLEVRMAHPREGKQAAAYEAIFRLADGRMLPVEVDILTLRVGARALRQFLVRDVAAHDQTTGVHRDRSWLDVFFDMPFIGMCITSPETRSFVRFNDRLCEIFGYTASELQALDWTGITHPEDLQKDLVEFKQVMLGEIDGYRVEKRFIRKDGSVVHCEIDVRCRRLPDGKVDYLVGMAQDITERFRAEERLRRQKNLYVALSRINTAITHLPDRTSIFQEACDAVVGIGRFKFAWIFSGGDGQAEYRFEAQAGDDRGYIRGVLDAGRTMEEVLHTVPHRAMRTGMTIVGDPYSADEGNTPWQHVAAAAGVAASAAFPLKGPDGSMAVLNVYASEEGAFDAEVVRLIEEMARDVSFSLENRTREDARLDALRALQAAEARARFALAGAGHGAWEWDTQTNRVHYSPQWKAMLDCSEDEISDSPSEWKDRIHPEDRQKTLRSFQEHLEDRTSSFVAEHRLRCKDGSYKSVLGRGQVLERSEDGAPWKVFGTNTDLTEVKVAEEKLQHERLRMELAQASAHIGTWDYDIASDKLHLHRNTPTLFGLGTEPFHMSMSEFVELILPADQAKFQAEVVQGLFYHSDDVSPYRVVWPDGSIHWIEGRGRGYRDAAGIPVRALGISMDVTERMETEAKIRDYLARLERSMLGTVDAITRMVELRDPYTAGHEARVGQLAEAIGRLMGLDDVACQGLQVVGRLHDLGKITVPAEILSKPGRLSEMEMNIVRTHPEQGYLILKDIEFDWPVAEIVRQHHERMNGSGYPRGLKGDEIMLEARILAVADVVESMSSHRPYRPSLGVEPALAEIESKAGTLYDMDVARACLCLFHEEGFKFEAREEGIGGAG